MTMYQMTMVVRSEPCESDEVLYVVVLLMTEGSMSTTLRDTWDD